MKKIIAAAGCSITLCIALGFTSCTRNVATEPKKTVTSKAESIGKGFDFDPLYQKEGFIDKNIFRVIIVTDKKESSPDLDAIKELGRKRSLASLQKYIQSSNKMINQTINAQLLNLIDSNGNLKENENVSEKHNVFFYEIDKQDVKRFVDSLTQK